MSVPDQLKTKRRARVNRMRRWDQIDDKMWNKWEKVFKEKFKNFKDSWTLAVTNDCPSTHEWEHSLEEKLSMACKCKDCNHVWVTDNGIVCFYYAFNKQSNTGEIAGKTLIVWVKPQLCPNKEKCGSSNLPMIDVYQDEVEAVLSYLMMEIGWYFYQINYSKDEENQIESQRKLRERKAKEKKNPQVKKGSSKLNGDIPSLDQIPPFKENVSGGLQIAKPNESKPPVDMRRITKLKNRWDKSPEQIKQEWELSFQNKFEYFTQKNPTHKWIMSLEKVTKDHPLRREQKWERFLGEKVEAGFKCPKCEYVWESKRAWISFWMWLNPPNSEGVRIGQVAVHILGQKCFNCPGNPNSKPYYTGDLQPEEIDAVLSFLLMEIDFHYYGNENYTDLHEEEIEKKRINSPIHFVSRGVHRKELCQPCQQKVCKKRVTAVYPNPVVPAQ
ncbi:uncharacterized protein LOC124193377 [Daphnia pulex]|uniref:uncharacterized protein LOC124193377 n=1 Tax=Daphnia pulex TaxID=6669 RepID=UPI001EDD0A1E|nr:uncharacterized protein LOC124193377 [Daphnia pulex]XP_046443104.1 uncharacterized protein LOC124193377 [Daphnia pulex]